MAAEVFGGLGLIVGLLTPLAALGVAIDMIVALATVHIPHGDPFVAKPGGHSAELASLYLSIAVLILAHGPGLFSLDALWAAPGRNRAGCEESKKTPPER
jgi:putative oxidoreductase